MLPLYKLLLHTYGPQGWWPVDGSYHPSDYSIPKRRTQKFEIIVGAILTQNTAWTNVEKALTELRKQKLLFPQKILDAPDSLVATSIRSAGYFNQKTQRVKRMAAWFCTNKAFEGKNLTEQRRDLLSINGIGKETADSILLYAYKKPVFVIDAYTKRILSRLGLLSINDTYDSYQEFFHSHLPRDVLIFNEFHALLVEHAKRFCKKRPECRHCPLRMQCAQHLNTLSAE